MRAIALATTFLIVLAMSATQPTLAADRTVPTLEESRGQAVLSAWIAELERAWVAVVLPGAGGLVLWTPVPLPADQETREAAELTGDEGKTSVILEDGAPF